ncbi:MAG: redoxin domain-containing protein [Planctomycetales bacterium]|nr:redoxin domain-containing protein [Planctomycetales bacterium]
MPFPTFVARRVPLLLVLALAAYGPSHVRAESIIGQRVENFTLRSHLGREWALEQFAEQPVVVVVFLGTECPLAKLYGPRLAEMEERFRERGVAFLAINANTQDSMTELSAYAERYKLAFPVLKDVGNRVADAMGAERTPEAYVLDQDRRIQYHGRIDDQYSVGVARDKVLREDLGIAIEELLAGKPISLAETEAPGCHIGRVKERQPQGTVTYNNQIARIFNQRCVECHRDGELAPFTLTSYQDVIGWEDTIAEVIKDNRMPPWFANPAHGTFANDTRLSDDEKQLVFRWIKNGMPEGDPADLPEPPTFVSGWRIPQPDEVLWMRDEPFVVPAQGTVDYQRFIVDPGWDEDKYIVAAEARPGNAAVVHHILAYVMPKNDSPRIDLRAILAGYVPGGAPDIYTDGQAIRVPAGSKLLFEMHYTPNGYEQSDRSYVGVCFAEEEAVTTIVEGDLAINTQFRIPPRAREHVVTAETRIRHDCLLRTMTPHMHLRGKAFRYEAIFPSGNREILLDIPKYDFNWQLDYRLAEPRLLPKNTRIVCTATYDNSERNWANPDPDRTVGWGDQSWDEMMIGFFDTIPTKSSKPQ